MNLSDDLPLLLSTAPVSTAQTTFSIILSTFCCILPFFVRTRVILISIFLCHCLNFSLKIRISASLCNSKSKISSYICKTYYVKACQSALRRQKMRYNHHISLNFCYFSSKFILFNFYFFHNGIFLFILICFIYVCKSF